MLKKTAILIFCFSINFLTAQTLTNLRCDLIEHTDQVYVNGRLSQIKLNQINKIIEPVQLAYINNLQPVFSWAINHVKNNTQQKAFQIQLAKKDFKEIKKEELIWDSLVVNSKNSFVKYNSGNLEPNTIYYWRVKIWNQDNKTSEWSKTQSFKTNHQLNNYATAAYPLTQTDEFIVLQKEISPSVTFYDFGKAAFGRIKLTINSAKTNDTLTVSFGEVITKSGRLNSSPGGSRRYRKVMLPLKQGTHTYTISVTKDKRNTRKGAILMPTYIGDVYPFRYCETEGNAKILNISRETVTYPFNDYSSSFESSNDTLNKIWEFCKYSIKATSFAGLYVDGDRERIPYEADAYINQLCHYGVDNEYTMARKTQEYLLFKPTWPTEWILSSVLMAWEDYLYTGNKDFIEKYYTELQHKTLVSLAEQNGLISTTTGKLTPKVYQSIHYKGKGLRDIVDWPHKGTLGLSNDDSGETDGFVFTDYNAVVNAYYNKALQVMSNIALAIGKTEDSKYYNQKAKEHKKTFNKLFFNTKHNYYRDGVDTEHSSLHSNMFALSFGLVPDKYVSKVTEYVKSRGMACSVYGSQHLLDAIYEGENADYGLELLTSKNKRGWAHAIYNVGTTISMEAWDNKFKPNQDWNHAWGAAPANIIPMRLMGIKPLTPGFEKFRIKPQPANLKWGNIKHPTIKGPVLVSFNNNIDNLFEMDVTIPANTQANVWIPCSWKKFKLTMNDKKVSYKKVRNFLIVKNVNPGQHHYTLTKKQ